MAWIYSAALEDLPSHSQSGSDLLRIVIQIHTAKLSYCNECSRVIFRELQSGMTLRPYVPKCCRLLISSTEVFHAKTSALQALKKAWKESEAGYSLSSCDWLADFDPASSSWRMCQLSLWEGLTEFVWSSLRWGTIVGGRLYQPRSLEPVICARDGGFVPTICARDDKSPGLTAQRRAKAEDNRGFPLSVWFKMKFGVRLFPGFCEWMMGYRPKHTVLEPWAMRLFQYRRGKRSKD